MPRVVFSLLSLVLSIASAAGADFHVYFGTYTNGSDSEGIYRSSFDSATGTLGAAELVATMVNPSFLSIHPDGKALYAGSEIRDGEIHAFLITSEGLERIGKQVSGGAGPCHLSMTPDGSVLGVANYGGGSVSSFLTNDSSGFAPAVSIVQHVGSSIHPKRQTSPKAHSINFSPDGKFAYAADLGADRIFLYRVDHETGELEKAGETSMKAGDGPRHFAFHPSGEFAYVINEMTRTVTAFVVNKEEGGLTGIQVLSTLPENAEATGSTAEIRCHPSGKFLYGSNRGHDSIVVYAIDQENGRLTYLENEPIQGKTPRNFEIDPTGKWLLAAGQNSDSVAVFKIDQETGELEYTGNSIEVSKPVCIRFLSVE